MKELRDEGSVETFVVGRVKAMPLRLHTLPLVFVGLHNFRFCYSDNACLSEPGERTLNLLHTRDTRALVEKAVPDLLVPKCRRNSQDQVQFRQSYFYYCTGNEFKNQVL